MKKEIRFLIGLLLLFSGWFLFNWIPIVQAKEAKTLGDLRIQLKNLESEKYKTESSKQKTKEQIQASRNSIKRAQDAIDVATKDIVQAQTKIEESNLKIQSIIGETKELLKFTQIMQGGSAYIEYISGASTLTEMIMRMRAVEQIVEYNHRCLDELQALIALNQQLQIDLKAKQEDLQKKIGFYENSIKSLGNDLSKLVSIADDIDTQIKNQKKLIKSYENMGCKEDQLLSQCVEITNNAGWRKPLMRGYVSSDFGWRPNPLSKHREAKFHKGIDLAGNKEGTKVYAAASGTVAAITYRSRCGGNSVYIHSYVLGKPYTHHYAHLLNYNVKVGQKVTTDTVIGYLGGGPKCYWDHCSTGAHLHFGVSHGFYLGGGPGSYSSFGTFVAKSFRPPGYPSKGSWFYHR